MPLFTLHKQNRSKQALNDYKDPLPLPLPPPPPPPPPHDDDDDDDGDKQTPSGVASPTAATAETLHSAAAVAAPPPPPPLLQQPQSASSQHSHSSPQHVDIPPDWPIRRANDNTKTAYSPVELPVEDSAGRPASIESSTHRRSALGSDTSAIAAPALHEPKKSRGLFHRIRNSRQSPEQLRLSAASPAPSIVTQPRGRRLVRKLSKRQVQTPPLRPAQDDFCDWHVTEIQSPQQLESPREVPEEEDEDEDAESPDTYLVRDPETQQLRVVVDPTRSRFSPVKEPLASSPSLSPRLDDARHSPSLSTVSLASPSSVSLDTRHRLQRFDPETASQTSDDSLTDKDESLRAPSAQSGSDFPHRSTSIQPTTSSSPSPTVSMAPGTSQQTRRTEIKQSPAGQQGQLAPRDVVVSHRHSYTGSSTANSVQTTSSQAPQPPNYSRGGSGSGHQYAEGGRTSEQGRSTPPPAPSERDIGDAYKELCK